MQTNDYVNKNIECTVNSCVNHCESEDYCALKKICVGTHGSNKNSTSDCKSFVDMADSRR